MCCTLLAGNTGRKKSPFWYHRTNLSGYIFGTKARINNRKKIVKQQYLLHMSWWYGELRSTNGWDLLASLGHTYKFQRVSSLGSVTARHTSSGRQPNFAALNRGRHQYSAGRPSRWALTHILVSTITSSETLAVSVRQVQTTYYTFCTNQELTRCKCSTVHLTNEKVNHRQRKVHSKIKTKMERSTPCKIATSENFILKLGTRHCVEDITYHTILI